MSSDEKRASDRVIPMVSDEEMVVVETGRQRHLAKMMDLSDTGTLVYTLSDFEHAPDAECRLSLYHNGKVITVYAGVIRGNGRLVAFRFRNVDYRSATELQAKLIRMEVEWTRLKGLL